MKKFSYKKMVDSLTFNCLSLAPGVNVYDLTVHSITTHPNFHNYAYLKVFDCNYPYAVGLAARSFLAALGSADTLPTLEFYHDGKLYTWHIDRYNHIIFRIYCVVK